MKILARGMIIATLMVLFLLIQTSIESQSIREQEIQIVASDAISVTQISARQQIEDRIYGTNNAICNANNSCFKSNDDYLKDLTDNIAKAINTDSVYTVDVYGIDYEKGLLDVGINCTYKTPTGKLKTLTTRKTSIVEIIGKEE